MGKLRFKETEGILKIPSPQHYLLYRRTRSAPHSDIRPLPSICPFLLSPPLLRFISNMALVSGQTKMRTQQQYLHQNLQAPDLPVMGGLTEGPRGHTCGTPSLLFTVHYWHSCPNLDHGAIQLSLPAFRSLSLTRQALPS